jgi:hypothetical protein
MNEILPLGTQLSLSLVSLYVLERVAGMRSDHPRFYWLFSWWGLSLASLPAAFKVLTTATAASPWFLLMSALLTWKAMGKDYAWASGRQNTATWRFLALGLAFASAVESLFLLPWALVLVGRLCLWTHHVHMPMRLILSAVSVRLTTGFLGLLPFGWTLDEASLLTVFAVAILVLHYWIPGMSKMTLGPRWYSWAADNTSHRLLPNAYLHGWLAFLPSATILRIARCLKPCDRVLQCAVLLIEAASPLYAFSSISFTLWLLLVIGMHAAIFLLTGLLFLEYTITCVGAIFYLSGSVDATVALLAAALGVALAGLRVIRPYKLAWWDSPFCGKVYLEATLETGQRVNLPNALFCPKDRDYGQCHAFAFLDEKLPYWHLGEVKTRRIHQRLDAAGPNPEELTLIAADSGVSCFAPRSLAQNTEELKMLLTPDFFIRKRFLPRWLRWLKMPIEFHFHWSPLPALDPTTDRIERLELVFREYYVAPDRIVLIREKQILTLPRTSFASAAPSPCPVPL